MRILYLANNRVGWQIGKWLVKQKGDDIVGLVLHPVSSRKYGDELLNTFNLSADAVFDASTLRSQVTLSSIKKLNADIAVSIFFGYILRPDFINLFPSVINLHPSYLPYNRGQYPNVWSIVEETPAGVTLHYIDENIDTGDIIAQKQVIIEPIDTGKTLYEKLEIASCELFTETWHLIRQGTNPRKPQPQAEGSFHLTKDVSRIDVIELDKNYTARHLINILRARTFSPYRGAYFVTEDGKRVNIRIELTYDDHET